ncbi:hypothetical protein D3C76_1602970 [compost metagenome]
MIIYTQKSCGIPRIENATVLSKSTVKALTFLRYNKDIRYMTPLIMCRYMGFGMISDTIIKEIISFFELYTRIRAYNEVVHGFDFRY